MSPLANEIYRLLLRRLRTRTSSMLASGSPPATPATTVSISYGDLADQVSRKIPTHRRSARFHAALGEVAVTCRRSRLPCLPAIVWRRDRKRPSDGYFAVAHPKVKTDDGRVAAWEREHELVVRAVGRYPSRL